MVWDAQWDHWLSLRSDHGDPRGDLGVVHVILMTEIVLWGESYEKCCWKCSRNHTGTTDRSMGNDHVIPGVILRVAYVILMRKVALSEQIGRDLIFWKCLPCNVIDKLCSILSHNMMPLYSKHMVLLLGATTQHIILFSHLTRESTIGKPRRTGRSTSFFQKTALRCISALAS